MHHRPQVTTFGWHHWGACPPNPPAAKPAKGGNSGNAIYDFYMGRELNPRWGSFDWKEFCELRPGLIGWALLNAAFVVVQKEKLGYVSGSMILVNVFIEGKSILFNILSCWLDDWQCLVCVRHTV